MIPQDSVSRDPGFQAKKQEAMIPCRTRYMSVIIGIFKNALKRAQIENPFKYFSTDTSPL